MWEFAIGDRTRCSRLRQGPDYHTHFSELNKLAVGTNLWDIANNLQINFSELR